MKPLDFVKTPKGAIALVMEIRGNDVSIEYIGESKGEKNAWWVSNQLKVIDSLPNLLARKMAHPFSHGRESVNTFFPIGDKK